MLDSIIEFLVVYVLIGAAIEIGTAVYNLAQFIYGFVTGRTIRTMTAEQFYKAKAKAKAAA